MTVKEYAKKIGVSVSTIYRRIKKGIINAFKRGRRWEIQETIEAPVEETSVEWNPQVHQYFANRDNKGPEEFRWELWPVSNVYIRQQKWGRNITEVCVCNISEDVPEPNKYDKDNQPIPDPVGIALSSIKFQMWDSKIHDKISESSSLPYEGEAIANIKGKFWNRFIPNTSIRVKVCAFPLFFYLDENGSARMDYTVNSNGYFKGETVWSPEYRLTMDEHGSVTLEEL